MSKRMSKDMSEIMSEEMSERMSKDISERMLEDMSERLSKDMSERMSEDQLIYRLFCNIYEGNMKWKEDRYQGYDCWHVENQWKRTRNLLTQRRTSFYPPFLRLMIQLQKRDAMEKAVWERIDEQEGAHADLYKVSFFCCTLLACHEGRGWSPSVSEVGEKTDLPTFPNIAKRNTQIKQQCKQTN